jgi:PAS domain S-box-containing protein
MSSTCTVPTTFGTSDRDIGPKEGITTVLSAREQALANREAEVSARERVTQELDVVVTQREELVDQRELALRARYAAEAAREAARIERERLVVQLRDANEQLVLATLRAEESAEAAVAARALAATTAATEAEGRRRAESLAAQLTASEQALRASELQFRTLANTVPMLAWYASPDGTTAWNNARWFELTGAAPDDRAGWQWQSFVDPGDLPRLSASWRAAIASGEPWEEVFRLRRHDGQLRWFLVRALALRDTDGQITRWFGVGVDIDDRKRAEAQLEASVHAKDEFLAMLGHELRNPLAPIISALDLMALIDPSAFPRERSIIQRQVHHMVRLVDDLLDVSRITGGKITLERAPIELADVVARALEAVSPIVDRKGHALQVDVPRGLVVDGDAVRLTQVVSNLLTNAAKYTPPHGSITVTGTVTGTGSGTGTGAAIVLRIRDTGIGISAEMLPLVFELFAQDRAGSDRAEGGLGLGLAIVRSLVTMHGGTVTARSDGPGRGTELVVELPASGAAVITSASRPTPRGLDTAESCKVLIVDDCEEATELMALSLARLGHEVRVAPDGEAALAAVSSFAPDAVLLDISLPGMDGYELARRLRSSLSPHAPRFIAITGHGSPADRRRSLEAGFAAHLVKPVGIATIHQSIRTADPARPSPPA